PPPAPTPIYTLSLHDALPIWSNDAILPEPSGGEQAGRGRSPRAVVDAILGETGSHSVGPPPTLPERKPAMPESSVVSDLMSVIADRKSTRLNSSHVKISYAVF